MQDPAYGLSPVKTKQSIRLKLKQNQLPGNLPPIKHRSQRSLSQLEEAADHLDRSRRTNDDSQNPYFDSAEKTMVSAPGRRSALDTNESGARSQLITKVKSLGLNSKSHAKNRPLIISKKYHQSLDKTPEIEGKNYSYLKTRYFQQPGQ